MTKDGFLTVANTKNKNSNKGRSKSAGASSNKKDSNIRSEVNAVILFAVTVALFVCFIGQFGIVGDIVNAVVFGLVGQPVAYILLIFFIYISWNLIRGNKGKPTVREAILFVLFCIIIGAIVHTFTFKYVPDNKYFTSVSGMWSGWKETVTGGFLGGSLSYVLQKYMTKVGAFVVLFPIGLILAMVLFSLSLRKAGQKVADAGAKAKDGIDRIKEKIRTQEEAEEEARAHGLVNTKDKSLADPANTTPKKKLWGRKKEEKKDAEAAFAASVAAINEEDDIIIPGTDTDNAVPISGIDDTDNEYTDQVPGDDEELKYVNELPGINFAGSGAVIEDEEYDAGEEEEDFIPGLRDREIEIEPVQKKITAKDADMSDLPTKLVTTKPKAYKKPSINLLAKGSNKPTNAAGQKTTLNEKAKKLEGVLESFDIAAKVINISKGPAVTRYELRPKAGVKVSKIKSLTDDIALNLAATSIKIEAPIPGKAAIGIEIPNTEVDMVYLRDLINSNEFRNHKSKLAFCVGKSISGDTIIADLAKMPHLLVAGTTGSGKSICINCIILSLLYNTTPDEVKLILIDPKMVEFAPYENMPHLMTPVVKDARKAAGALAWAVQQMNERYALFSGVGVRDVKGYNAYAEQNGLEKLPFIVIIIDELADLMTVAHNAVEESIIRLAQMARAAGMHLIVATQRPSVDVVTGLIKANVPSRIALKTASQVDSRTIIDTAGAEKLLGRGDMIYKPGDSIHGERLQGAFVSDEEVATIIDYIKNNNGEAVMDEKTQESFEKICESGGQPEQKSGGAEPGEDEMLAKAIDLTLGLKQISASLLQRKFAVGYNRAARLIDQMEERGIISQKEGSNPRNVLITREEYEINHRKG